MIELDEKSAQDLNDLFEYADSLPMMQKFSIGHYTSDVLGGQTKASYTYYMSLKLLAQRLMRKYDAKWLLIDEMGDMWSSWETRAFLDQGGFFALLEKEKQEKELNRNIIRTNNASRINVIATIIFGLIVTLTTILTCQRESRKENREERQLLQDSVQQLQQSRHDSLYEKYLLRKVLDSLTSSKAKVYDSSYKAVE